MMRPLIASVLPAAAALLAACAPQPSYISNEPVQQQLRLVEQGESLSLDLRKSGHGVPQDGIAKIRALVKAVGNPYGVRVALTPSRNIKNDELVPTMQALEMLGVQPQNIRIDGARTESGRQLTVRASVDVVELPDCKGVDRDAMIASADSVMGLVERQPPRKLGCATATNLGLMLADPRELTDPRKLGNAYGTRETGAVELYQTDKVKPLPSTTSTQGASGG